MQFRFSNKIQSSKPGWQEHVVAVATNFCGFDGDLYDYDALIASFAGLSDRLPGSRDEADFRDEFGAYGKFLGIHYEFLSNGSLYSACTETSKKLLLSTEADVASFLRLQLPLFQYPNGIGLRWHNGVRV